jgi:predicted phosphodiesterase
VVPVTSIVELEILSKVDQSIYEILSDRTLGRSAVASALKQKKIVVSEKLVRTWRYANMPALPVQTVGADKAYTIVVMPDVQAPLHDEAIIEKFIQFLADYKPNELAQVGDFTDSTEISRWVRGKKLEFAGDLQSGFDSSRAILEDIREVFDGRFRIVRSNHDDRLENYIETCAPGLNFRDLTIEHQAGFTDNDVEFVRDAVVELAPGWVMAHGDEGSLSPVAGKTALGLAKNKFGVSVICGHTHRAGITPETYGYNSSNFRNIVGMEVGHFMDITKADYLKKKGAAANWQQGFGILEVYGERVFEHLVSIKDGHFSVNGILY